MAFDFQALSSEKSVVSFSQMIYPVGLKDAPVIPLQLCILL